MQRHILYALCCLLALPAAAAAQQQAADESAVRSAVAAFGRALASGDSTAALAVLHPDVVIFEGGGWESFDEYRKGHLGADMRALQGVKQETLRDAIRISGDLALATREYATTTTTNERRVGVETMVLLRTSDGWKIRHIHWSSRRPRPSGD